jgi:hypothetical protein
MSTEADYGRRAARFYGPIRVRLSRAERIGWLRQEIAKLEALRLKEQEDHWAHCEDCQRSAFCFELLVVTPVESERLNRLRFMTGLIYHEEQDALYAQHARERGVEYKKHIDGFCRYWQNLRHRKFVSVDWKCEGCGCIGNLDAHHLHYDTLGFEELCDLQALCRSCHQKADRQRAETTRYNNAMETYMQKKYGDYWPDDAHEEFDEWLERKEDEGW